MRARPLKAVRPRPRGAFQRHHHRGTLITHAAGHSPVLMYHGVGRVAEDPFGLFVSPERFGQQMATLATLGLRGVSVRDLMAAREMGQAAGLVGLTFDDGYRESLPHVVPVLERHGYTGTLYAVSGLLAGENVWDPPPRHSLVDGRDVKEWVSRGMEIGSHGATHVRLAALDERRLREEVMGSRLALAEVTGTQPDSFCYPYGSVDPAAVRAVAEAGYSSACAVWRVPGAPPALTTPRVGVTERDASLRLALKLLLRGR
jgi:peptidoglycan/xylan/chitin deacetylase (PgdA/CDA1 family)